MKFKIGMLTWEFFVCQKSNRPRISNPKNGSLDQGLRRDQKSGRGELRCQKITTAIDDTPSKDIICKKLGQGGSPLDVYCYE